MPKSSKFFLFPWATIEQTLMDMLRTSPHLQGHIVPPDIPGKQQSSNLGMAALNLSDVHEEVNADQEQRGKAIRADQLVHRAEGKKERLG